MRQEIQDAVMKVYDETDEVIPDKNATSDNERIRRSLIKNVFIYKISLGH